MCIRDRKSTTHLFGLEKKQFFTFTEAQQYCIEAYKKTLDEDKSSLHKLYHSLRGDEPKLPADPVFCYKNKGWKSTAHLFGLEKKQIFTFTEAQTYCTKAYKKASDKDKSSLGKLYRSLREHEPKLPPNPVAYYKDKGGESIAYLFGLGKQLYFTFKETQAYCSEAYKMASDKDKSSFQKLYHSLRNKEPKLNSSPSRIYKDKGWKSFAHLFGLEKQLFFTFKEAQAYCIKAYEKALDEDKSSLQNFYRSLRNKEPKLNSSPTRIYKDKGWKSFAHFFDLEADQAFTFEQSQTYCIKAYKKASDEDKSNLRRFYEDLRYIEERLPNNFYKNAKFQSMSHLFGLSNYYTTLTQSRNAFKKLVSNAKYLTKNGYYSAASIDTRLPPTPKGYYQEWVCWESFLTEKSQDYYTYDKAKEVANQLADEHGVSLTEVAISLSVCLTLN